jgi:acetyl-CoA carboxylase carboxyl transferase subunit alpha
MRHYLDFEKPIAELEGKIEELRRMSEPGGINIADEVARLTTVADRQLRTAYARLTPWQKTLVARHPDRPKAMDYFAALISDFTPLAGDRAFADDAAVLGGLGRFRGRSVVVLGTEKGADTESRVKHNFGMARPEGYRKARRLIELAGRFGLPILTFVDTSGAFPGIDAEARGQGEAIALAAGDRVLMLEHAIYSVISPEGCASILWRDAAQATAAAEALRLTAEDLKRLALVDLVIPEPLGGAQRDAAATIAAVGDAVADALLSLIGLDGATLKSRRREKFLNAGREGLT